MGATDRSEKERMVIRLEETPTYDILPLDTDDPHWKYRVVSYFDENESVRIADRNRISSELMNLIDIVTNYEKIAVIQTGLNEHDHANISAGLRSFEIIGRVWVDVVDLPTMGGLYE